MMEFQIRVDIKRGRYKVSTTIKKYKDEISKGIFRVPALLKIVLFRVKSIQKICQSPFISSSSKEIKSGDRRHNVVIII